MSSQVQREMCDFLFACLLYVLLFFSEQTGLDIGISLKDGKHTALCPTGLALITSETQQLAYLDS